MKPDLFTELPSREVLAICDKYMFNSCNGCPILRECFDSHTLPDHYAIVNLAAEALIHKQN